MPPMSEKERMLNALFPAKGEGATNVKFFLGDDRNVTEEELAREFNQALEQEKLKTAKRSDTLDKNIARARVADFIPE